MFLHPGHIEAEMERAATALGTELLASQARGWPDDSTNPLAHVRAATTRERFEQIKALPIDPETKDALLRWQACLTIERVTWDDRAAAEAARQRAEHVVQELQAEPLSIHALVQRLVVAKDPALRSKVAQEIVIASGDASSKAMGWATHSPLKPWWTETSTSTPSGNPTYPVST